MRFLLLLCALFPALTLYSQDTALVRETFDYATFNPLFVLGGEGEGWTGPWERLNGDIAVVRRANLGDDGPARPRGYASFDFVRDNMRCERKMTRVQDDGDDLWVAYTVDFGTAGGPTNNVANLTLTRAGNQVLSFGRTFGGGRIGLVWPNAAAVNSTVAAEGVRRLVIRIRFSGDTGNEEVTLWIDPPADGAEPDPADAALTVGPDNGPRLNIGLDGVQLKVEGTPPLLVGFDNIFVGRNYTAVSPDLTSLRPRAYRDLPLKVFPNPTDGPLTVAFTTPAAGPLNVELYDATGRRLRSRREVLPGAGSQSIELSGLTAGLPEGNYTLVVVTGGARGIASLSLAR